MKNSKVKECKVKDECTCLCHNPGYDYDCFEDVNDKEEGKEDG